MDGLMDEAMEDMTTLRAFRTDTPGITPAAEEAARERLLGAMTTEPSRRAAPGGGRLRAIRPPRLALRAVTVGALAVGLAIGVTVAQSIGGSHGERRGKVGVLPGAPVAEAAELAKQARTAAAATPEAPLAAGAWTYTKDLLVESDGGGIGRNSRRTAIERWYTADGRRFATRSASGKVSVRELQGHDLRRGFLNGAPADPAGMLRRVYAELDRIVAAQRAAARRQDGPPVVLSLGIDPSRGRDVAAFELIARTLRWYYVSPRQQAALYGALARIPGVRVLADSADPLGRHGRAFYLVDAQRVRSEIIIDPRSYRYLGQKSIFTADWRDGSGPAFKKGTIIGWSAQVASGIVPGPGDRP